MGLAVVAFNNVAGGGTFAEDNRFDLFTEAEAGGSVVRNTALSHATQQQDTTSDNDKKKRDEDVQNALLSQDLWEQMDKELQDLYKALGHDISDLDRRMRENRENRERSETRQAELYTILESIEEGSFVYDREQLERAGIDPAELDRIEETAPPGENPSAEDVAPVVTDQIETETDIQGDLDSEYERLEAERDFKQDLRQRILPPPQGEGISAEQAINELEAAGYELGHSPDGEITARKLARALQIDSDKLNDEISSLAPNQ